MSFIENLKVSSSYFNSQEVLKEEFVEFPDSSESQKLTKFVFNPDQRRKYLSEFDRKENFEVPADLQVLFDTAEAFYYQGLDSKAYQFYLKYINSGDHHPVHQFISYKNIGNIKIRSGDLLGAEIYYNKAFTINPDSDVILVNLGTLEMQRFNLEKALERYRSAVEINFENSRAWIGLSLVHREYGDIDLAWANLLRALDLSPHEETAIELLLQWGVKDARFDRALEGLTHYLLENPKNFPMKIAYAKLLIIGGRLPVARSYIEKNFLEMDISNSSRDLRKFMSEMEVYKIKN